MKRKEKFLLKKIPIFEVTNAKFFLDLSYGMVHHCTKFGENRSHNFCVIAFNLSNATVP